MAEKQVIVKGQYKDEIAAQINKMSASVVSDLKQMATGFAVGVLGVQAFKTTIIDSVKAAVEEERQINRLNSVLALHRGAVKSSASALSDWAEQQMMLTGISDDAYRSALSLSIGLGRTEEEAKKLAKTAADASVVLGRDMGGVVEALNKSYGGNLRELRMLIPELADLGEESLRAGGAVKALGAIVGGGAEGANTGTVGNINALRNSVNELKESFGGLLLVGADANASPIVKFLGMVGDQLDAAAKAANIVLDLMNRVGGEPGSAYRGTRENRSKAGVDAMNQEEREALRFDRAGRAAAGGSAVKSEMDEFVHTVAWTRQQLEAMGGRIGSQRAPMMTRGRSATGIGGSDYWDAQPYAIDPMSKSFADSENERWEQFNQERERAIAMTADVMGSFVDGFSQSIRAGEGFFTSVSSGFESLGASIQRMLMQMAVEAGARKLVSLIPGLGTFATTADSPSMVVTPTISMQSRRAARYLGPELARSGARGHI